MVYVEEIFTAWQLRSDVVFLEVAGDKHCKRTAKHEKVLYWENQLNVFVIETKFRHKLLI